MMEIIAELTSPAGLAALGQVIAIDLVLAGDNALAVGMAAAGLPAHQRGKVILIGIVAATVLRIVFALATTQLMNVFSLLVWGGVLLLWVSWKLFRELREGGGHAQEEGERALEGETPVGAKPKTFMQAAIQIIAADVSMSLDNVLAVAGAAHDHPTVLIIGLVLSVALMGVAATLVARILQKYRWVAYIGVLIIFYVALEMIWKGANQSYGEMVADWPAFRLWVIALHIVAATIWIGGMICLPLLYAAHVRGRLQAEALVRAEQAILRAVIAPAMIFGLIFGAVLLVIPGEPALDSTWLWVKLAGVVVLLALHGVFVVQQRRLAAGAGMASGYSYDGFAALSLLVGAVIVIMVTVQPF